MIVRVKYSCTSEQKKLLNIPLLQKDLYDWGAFYVSDIEAENAIDVTNRGLLSEESDPTLNLKKYLEEKCFKNPDKIVELAEPIIAEAMKQSTTAEIHGVFRPISIAVRNYRNYKEENFDFSDISFCTINGVNGAGKSRATLDVLINEYGKTTLPYASKSGGEKVKASLAIILALSEIKATSAGIQLGMLFIDEPPFLDDDGTQAYVDALETIRQRYPDVKIMAITHDDAMKARFNQSVTVIKTEDGSKVIY